MSQEDLDGIQSVQVLTDFEDTFYVTEMGLTVFENDAFNGDIAEWKLKDKLLANLKSEMPAAAKIIEVKSFQTETQITEGWNSLASEFRHNALEKKADTVIVLARNGFYSPAGGGYWEVDPKRGGFGFYTKSIFGKPVLTCPFLSFYIRVYRTSDGKLLGAEQDRICDNQNTVEIAQEFSKYSPEQREFIKSTIEKGISGRFVEKVRSVFKPAAVDNRIEKKR
jgi:hypothetical protein